MFVMSLAEIMLNKDVIYCIVLKMSFMMNHKNNIILYAPTFKAKQDYIYVSYEILIVFYIACSRFVELFCQFIKKNEISPQSFLPVQFTTKREQHNHSNKLIDERKYLNSISLQLFHVAYKVLELTATIGV